MTDCKSTLPLRIDAFENNNIIKGSLDYIKKKKITKFLCPELSSSFFLYTKKITVSEEEGSGEAQVCLNFILISYF